MFFMIDGRIFAYKEQASHFNYQCTKQKGLHEDSKNSKFNVTLFDKYHKT